MTEYTDTTNPYAAPSSNLEPELTAGRLSFINAFKRFTAWGVFGLTLITAGIYIYYWMFTRGKNINTELSDENKISPLLTNSVIATGLIYTVFSYLPSFVDSSALQVVTLVMMLFMIIYMVVYLTWIFKFRNRLNMLTNAKKGDQLWLGGIMTFFFNVIYFQYKINQIHDNKNSLG